MPAPDVCYFLDNSASCGHIAGDTYFYFMNVSADSNRLVDGYEDRAEFERHWNRLVDMGLYLENHFIKWRSANPADAPMASLMGLRTLKDTVRELLDNGSSELVDKGMTDLDQTGIAMLEKRWCFSTSLEILRRSLKRTGADLGDLDGPRLRDVRDQVDAMIQRNYISQQLAIEQIKRTLRAGGDDETYFVDEDRIGDARTIAQAKKFIRNEIKQQRSVIKRSVKFMNKLVGNDVTRMFIGGDVIRFEGEHCVYEMKKTATMTTAHGGARLSVFTKGDDIHLCDLCIYTPNVPLLDHVASIALHLRAGEEDQILDIGNAYNINDSRAYKEEWLVPYLPKVRSGEFLAIPDPDDIEGFEFPLGNRTIRINPAHERPKIKNRREKRLHMRKQLGRYLFDNLLVDYAPLMRATDQLLSAPRPNGRTLVQEPR